MHIDSDIFGILFGITVFGLLVYKLYRLVITNLVPYLSEQTRLIKKKQIELLEKEKLITTTLNKIYNQTKQQQKMFILLEKKIKLWHKVMRNKKLKYEEDYNKIAEHTRRKRERQRKNFIASKIAFESVPHMMNLARKELINNYSGDEGAQLLRHHIKKLDFLVSNFYFKR